MTDRAPAYEWFKRGVWINTSLIISAVPGVFLAGVVGRTLFHIGVEAGTAVCFLVAVPVFLLVIAIDYRFVFPWGVERFDISHPKEIGGGESGGEV